MKSNLQSQINPMTAQRATLMSGAKVKEKEKIVDSNAKDEVDFDSLLTNSNEGVERERAAKIGGDLASTNRKEFYEKLSEQTNQDIRVPKNKLTKDDFLKLFVEQMKNQDPLNPDDGAELAAKMAQFNSVEQMMNMNKSLEAMTNDKSKDRSLMLTNFLGKEIDVDGGRLRLENSKVSESTFKLPNGASRATLEIRDESGQMVFDRNLGAIGKGNHKLSWDGRNKNGIELPPGVYSYSVVAKDLNDQSIPVGISSRVKVLGVDVMDKAGKLYTDYGSVKFNDIKSVGEKDYDAASKDKESVNNIKISSAAKAEASDGDRAFTQAKVQTTDTESNTDKTAAGKSTAKALDATAANNTEEQTQQQNKDQEAKETNTVEAKAEKVAVEKNVEKNPSENKADAKA